VEQNGEADYYHKGENSRNSCPVCSLGLCSWAIQCHQQNIALICNLCFSSRKLAFIRQFHPHWRSLHCLWRQSKIDDGIGEDSSYRTARTRASKGEEAAIQWDVFRGRPRAVHQGKIQNFSISSHFRFFVDGISSENGSGLSVHLADIFWSVTTRICVKGTFLIWDWRRSVWGWDNWTRWLH